MSILAETPIRFGTDGWRAVIGGDYTFRNVGRVAQGFATFVRRNWRWENGIVVGYDRRFGSERFAPHVASVLAGNSIPVHLVNVPCPTPVAAFSTAALRAAGAVMITASHNPPADNGFKIRTATGAAVDPAAVGERRARRRSARRTEGRRAQSRSTSATKPQLGRCARGWWSSGPRRASTRRRCAPPCSAGRAGPSTPCRRPS